MADDKKDFSFKCPQCQAKIDVTPELLVQMQQDVEDAERWRAAVRRGQDVFGRQLR